MKSPAVYIILFILSSIAELCAEYYDIAVLRYCSKPLLMITLAGFFYFSYEDKLSDENRLMLYALFFAWVGDVALMLNHLTEYAFMIGLGAFLICHVLYIMHFNAKVKQLKGVKGFVFENKFIIVLFIFYASVLITFIYPMLGSMKVPVFLYCAVIMSMCIVALNRITKTNATSATMILVGAFMFMFSDSIIALNKFSSLFEDTGVLAPILIMSLYILGQFFIVEGSIQHERSA
ncbi:MAG: lysoplasmalogenase [Bacteroidota bacterium]